MKTQKNNESFQQPGFQPTAFGRIMMYNESGNVARLHMVSTLQRWSVGRHVYGTQVIAMELCRINMLDCGRCLHWLLNHDLAEVYTGDIPAPTKRRSPAIDEALNAMEAEFERLWDVTQYRQDLRDVKIPVPDMMTLELGICKAADALDLGVCMLLERTMGNRHATLNRVFDNIMDYTEGLLWIPGVLELRNDMIEEWHKHQ